MDNNEKSIHFLLMTHLVHTFSALLYLNVFWFFLKIAFHSVSLTVLLDCYTIYAVKQERFLQDFDKVPDKK